MTKRTFDQYCPIARALDVVGERWSLLIVRELLLGPRRYTDLRVALPGMWTNLLAERLRDLEAAGVVRRVELPPPAARTVYELTEDGQSLESVILALAVWGMPRLGSRPSNHDVPTSTALLAGLRGWFRADLARDIDDVYEIRLAETVFTAEVRHGRVRLTSGRPSSPVATLIVSPGDLLALRRRQMDGTVDAPSEAFRIEGSRAGSSRLRRVFALPRL